MERLIEQFEVVDGKVDDVVRIGAVDGKVLGVVGESLRSCNVDLLVNSVETNLSVNFAANPNDSNAMQSIDPRVPQAQDRVPG